MESADKKTLIEAPRTVDQVAVWLSEALQEAQRLGATDLHFFPGREDARLWLRIDGLLHEACVYARSMHDRAISRLKVMARCPDYVREAVTEGRFSAAPLNGSRDRTEARLSIIPSLHGEKAVVRLLGSERTNPALGELGFSERLCRELEQAGSRPQGLLLVTGPSGSGKSTTLAALLRRVFESNPNPLAVLTLEDPPEIPMPFATQVAVDPDRGLGFAPGLRALLRQDPEVLLVGEVRDPETAQVALNAALTGHRLFSTMHTLNAGEALVRLQDMGAAPYMLGSALGGILSQRLVRRPCPACSTSIPLERWTENRAGDPAFEEISGLFGGCEAMEAAVASGCEECNGIGYRGRTALGEWALVSSETVEALMRRHTARDLEAALEYPVSARDEALEAIRTHRTTPDEIERLFLMSPLGRGGVT